jgi:hypothetical protein
MTATQLQFPEPVHGTVNPAAGERAKERGMARAEKSTERPWAARCDDAIAVMAARGVPFQASDMVREGLVEEPADHHQWGPRFGNAAKHGVVRRYTPDQSKRATSRRSLLNTWIGTDTREVAA